jgi:hypothetical protein
VHLIYIRLTNLFTILFLLLIVAACAPKPTATPYLTATITLGAQPTLPPTWTPTHTFTSAPTRMPTDTPAPVPTISAADICKGFSVIATPDPKVEVSQDGSALFGWKNIPSGVRMRLYIWERGSRAGIFADVPIPGDGLLPIPAQRLPESYYFNWRLWIEHPAYGQICVHQGTFTRQVIMTF